MNYKKVIISSLLLLYCLWYATDTPNWHFIDNVDLIIHEAGHIVFAFMGQFMTILGGSLFQILMPLIFVGYFFFKEKFFSASVILYWVGINFINVSVYAGDAVKMQLPLLGGDTDGHDWHNLLSILGWLNYTELISNIIFYTGILIFFVAFLWAIYILYTENQRVE